MGDAARTLPGDQLTLRDRLSRLTFKDACGLLGSQGRQLIQNNANTWAISVQDDVHLGDDLLRVRFPAAPGVAPAITTITLMAEARHRLHVHCNQCETLCDHLGATFSLVLEEKLAMGLAELPPEREPVVSQSDEDLVERALSERAERARTEKMKVKSADPQTPTPDWESPLADLQAPPGALPTPLAGLETPFADWETSFPD